MTLRAKAQRQTTCLSTCPECQRAFGSVRGLSQHRRRAHPAEYHTQIVPIARLKAHWDHEELLVLARPEIIFRRSGVRNINQRLVQITPGRTLDAIKGVRKSTRWPLLNSRRLIVVSSNLNDLCLTPVKGPRTTFLEITLQPLQSNLLSERDRSGTPHTTSACQIALTFKPSALVIQQTKPGPCLTWNTPGGYHPWLDPERGHPDVGLGPPGYGLDNQCSQRG